MYIYNIEVIVRWSYHDNDEEAIQNGDPDSYRVSGQNFDQAMAKVEKLATDKKRIWSDDGEDGKKTTHKPLYIVDVIGVTKEDDKLDG